MDRSWQYVVSVLGILKAGAAYLPLEVSYPQHLLDSVLEDATPVAVCTTKKLVDRSHKMEKSRVINMDGFKYSQYIKWNDFDYDKMTPASVPVSLDDMACIVYSSGTTGKPKVTRFTHRDALFSHTWRHRAYPYKHDDRVAVLSAWDMLGPLIKGIGIYLIPDDGIHDPKILVDYLHRRKITRVLFTPSLLRAVLEHQDIDLKKSLNLSGKSGCMEKWLQQNCGTSCVTCCHGYNCSTSTEFPSVLMWPLLIFRYQWQQERRENIVPWVNCFQRFMLSSWMNTKTSKLLENLER
ncbi:tyrocidine synthase 1-like [Nilaparvata lugens]|uniref:tyrocidine synthase 1-like n=1 Tax=Nilaparvata lugens TaxID=108931 RepID=UPI00193E9F84|nr:tyrocidine synthase 1-like [Nilaparvata lugens]